jgi:hypothetical protein
MNLRKFLPTVTVALMLTASAVAQCGGPACEGDKKPSGKGKQATITGVISDAACGRKHKMMADKGDAECTRECVKMGSKYALISGKKVYTLEGGDAEALNKLAGAKAEVSGTVDGDTIQVSSVAAKT